MIDCDICARRSVEISFKITHQMTADRSWHYYISKWQPIGVGIHGFLKPYWGFSCQVGSSCALHRHIISGHFPTRCHGYLLNFHVNSKFEWKLYSLSPLVDSFHSWIPFGLHLKAPPFYNIAAWAQDGNFSVWMEDEIIWAVIPKTPAFFYIIIGDYITCSPLA